MAEEAPDFMAQVRALNPDLKDYDDTTLAAAIADQHPDYKPRLQKWLHPPEAASGQPAPALPDPGAAAADLEKTLPTQRTTLAEALNTPSPSLVKAAQEIKNPYLGGAAEFAAKQLTMGNAALMGGISAAGPVIGRAAAGLFGTQSALGTLKSIPELWKLYQAGDYDQLARRATEAGLGALVAGLGIKHAVSGSPKAAPETPAATPTGEPIASPEAAQATKKAMEKAAEVTADLPKASAAAQAAIDRAAAEESANLTPAQAVKTAQGSVVPNPRASEQVQANLETALKDAGIDAKDPRAIASHLGEVYNLGKPVEVMFTHEKVSSSFDRPDSYLVKIPVEWTPDMIAHEIQHARVQEGQIPKVPEGQGANDQISSQVTKDLEPVAGLNPKYYDVSESVKRDILEQSQDIPKRGPISWEESVANGTAMGLSLDDATAMSKASDQWVATAAAMKGHVSATMSVREAAVKSYQADPTPANGKALDVAHKNAMQALANQTELASNGARVLNIQRMEAGALTPTQKFAQESLAEAAASIKKLAEGGKDVAKANAKLREAPLETPEQVDQFRKSMSLKGVSMRRKVGFYYVNSICSALPTSFVKAASDAAATISSPLRTVAGGTLNRINYELQSAAGREIPGGKPHPIAESQAALSSLWSAMNDALAAFGKSIEEKSLGPLKETRFGKSLSTGSTVYSRQNPIGSGIRIPYSAEGATLMHPYGGIGGTPKVIPTAFVGKVVGTPMRVLGAITDAFLQTNVRRELYEQGIRKALNEGKTGSEAWQAAREYVDAMPADSLKTIDETVAGTMTPEQVKGLKSAQTEARKDTSTQEPGKLTKAFIGVRENIPGGAGYIEAPIITTPQNIVKAAFETSPFGLMSIVKDIVKGDEISNSKMGRAALGTLAWVWAYNYAKAGRLTGAGPTDSREFNALYKTGWRPNSLQTPVGYVPLRFLGPFGFSLGTIADIAEIQQDAPRAKGDTDYQKLATASAEHMSRFILDMPMLQGLHDMFETIQDPIHYGPIAAGRSVGGFVPSIVARAGASIDDSQRRIDGFTAAIKARVPFWREELSPKRDMYGQPIAEPGTPIERSLSPSARSEAIVPNAPERAYLEAKIGPVSGTMNIPGKGHFALNREDLDRLEVITGAKVKSLMDRLDRQGTTFAMKPDEQKQAIVKDMVNGAREQARLQLMSELKKKGVWQRYIDAAAGRTAAMKQPNPYLASLDNPTNDRAMELLERYYVPTSGLPKEIPPELADEYEDRLKSARAQIYHSVASSDQNAAEFGSLDPDDARQRVLKLEKLATDLAKKQTLAVLKAAQNRVQSGAAAPP